MKVFVCVNSYADGEYLFVRGSLESAKQAMKERYARMSSSSGTTSA